MIGRRATVGLSLLCALLFSAFAAQSASATKGFTAVTCEPTVHGDWKDGHCTTNVPGAGNFEHTSLPTNPTTITITNTETASNTKAAAPTIVKGTLGGVASEIACNTVSGHGTIQNTAGIPAMTVHMHKQAEYTGCTVVKPADGGGKPRCTVEEPIVSNLESEGKIISESPEEMSINFTAKEGEIFTTFNFKEGPGTKCPVAGKGVNMTGNAEATQNGEPNGAGATLVFTNAMTKGVKCGEAGTSGVCLGGKSAELSGTWTDKMAKEQNGKVYPEDAVTLTTFAT